MAIRLLLLLFSFEIEIDTFMTFASIKPFLTLDSPLVHCLHQINSHISKPTQINKQAADQPNRCLDCGVYFFYSVSLIYSVLQVHVIILVIPAEVTFSKHFQHCFHFGEVSLYFLQAFVTWKYSVVDQVQETLARY